MMLSIVSWTWWVKSVCRASVLDFSLHFIAGEERKRAASVASWIKGPMFRGASDPRTICMSSIEVTDPQGLR